MAVLSENLVKEFVKITNDDKKEKKETFMYGTVHIADNHMDVLLDGARTSTPCTTTVTVEDGDRVVVMLKNREAVITANISNPTITVDTLKAKDIEFSGILTGADGSFAGTVTVDWGNGNPQMDQVIKLGSDTTSPFVITLDDPQQDDASWQDAWGFYAGKNGGQTYSQLTAEGGLETTKIRTTQINLGIDRGSITGSSIPSHSYKDYSVSFSSYVYTYAPFVVACFAGTSSSPSEWGSCSCTVHSITTAGCKIRVYNNSSVSLSPNIHWIAIGGPNY